MYGKKWREDYLWKENFKSGIRLADELKESVLSVMVLNSYKRGKP